jgi:hypothetical protein
MFALLDSLFGCRHRRLTFPITAKRDGETSETYVVCLDCGNEFPYNWHEMKMARNVEVKMESQSRLTRHPVP